MYGVTRSSFFRAGLIVNVAFVITFLSILGRHFFLSDPVGRRRIKWVLYATYVAGVPQAVLLFLMFLNPSHSLWALLASVDTLFIFIPLSVFIAIVRFNLFDIDRLISATTAYTIVSVFVIAAALAILPTPVPSGAQRGRARSGSRAVAHIAPARSRCRSGVALPAPANRAVLLCRAVRARGGNRAFPSRVIPL